MVSKTLKMVSKTLKFRPAFRWEKEIEDFIASRIEGRSINVPCGESFLGDVRVDCDHSPARTMRGDMFRVPFASRTFDTVITDPPWKLTPLQRPKHFFEAFRVCKIGGQIILNAPWLPHSKFPVIETEEIMVRQSWPFSTASIVSVTRKTGEVPNHWA